MSRLVRVPSSPIHGIDTFFRQGRSIPDVLASDPGELWQCQRRSRVCSAISWLAAGRSHQIGGVR